MADSQLNLVDAAVASPSATRGDVPERLRRRYLTDEHNGPGLGFYVDASIPSPAFRDQGDRLSTDRNDPNVIRDLVAIAQHRGWTIISVRGQTAFRRETWLTARSAGLEVLGYRPTERDMQDLARRTERTRNATADRNPKPRASPDPATPGASARLKIVEAVVRDRIVEPAVQARILITARSRIADWLERGARRAAPSTRAPEDPLSAMSER
jgi:hypothetical protein